jgi:hypothetical protein
MLSDFEILRIPETQDFSRIQKAYKRLIKEIHPDVSTQSDIMKNHLLFIQINKAYQRLVNKIGGRKISIIPPKKDDPSCGTAMEQHKDPAYVFYKTAMNSFMRIHPSQWTIDTKKIAAHPDPRSEDNLKKVQEKVESLVKLFPKAYYYFSIVVHEYPDSVWVDDSKQKMALIEERTIRYKKIIESFTEHAKEVPRVNKMFFHRGSHL